MDILFFYYEAYTFNKNRWADEVSILIDIVVTNCGQNKLNELGK